MIVHNRKSTQRRGKGLVNSIINKLPVELPIPGYQYCGSGTKLKERLARGDPGINPLDAACKEHDIAYSKNRDNLNARHAADRVLTERAWKRVLAKDASLGEKAAAWGVANTMKAKTKLGMGVRRKRKPSKSTEAEKGVVETYRWSGKSIDESRSGCCSIGPQGCASSCQECRLKKQSPITAHAPCTEQNRWCPSLSYTTLCWA